MCGRYTLVATGEEVAERFAVAVAPDLARYNLAPTQTAPIVVASRPGPEGAPPEAPRRLVSARWGLVPFWADDPAIGNRMINARVEGLASKPAWRRPFRQRRCLVPATGFFEWLKEGKHKRPHLIRMKDGGLFAFAGLWDHWRSPEGLDLFTFAIVTGPPNPVAARIHDRMPVILPEAAWDRWLSRELTDPARLEPLLVAYPEAAMEAVEVSPVVGNPDNDDPRCVTPLQAPPPSQ